MQDFDRPTFGQAVNLRRFTNIQEELSLKNHRLSEAIKQNNTLSTLNNELNEKLNFLENKSKTDKNLLDDQIITLSSQNEKLKINLLKYESGYGFIPIQNKKEITLRLKKLNLFKYLNSQDNKFYEKKIGYISGIVRSSLVTHNFEPDYKIWCMSIIKEIIYYFSGLSKIEDNFFTEQNISLILDMIREELLKNGKVFRSKNDKDYFIEIQRILSDYFIKVNLYRELPKSEDQFVNTQGNDGYWRKTTINQDKVQRLSQEVKDKISELKEYLNIIYKYLEDSLYNLQEISKIESEVENRKPITKREENKKMLQESLNRLKEEGQISK